MNIAIAYDSKTGTTAKAAEAMRKTFEEHGHQCQVQSITEADPTTVVEADLICVGTWVKGLFIIFQHPNPESFLFIHKLGELTGKQVVVFCTYLLAAGSTLSQMVDFVESKGGKVIGQFKYRGSKPNTAFAKFVKSLT
jgi:flavodoxin